MPRSILDQKRDVGRSRHELHVWPNFACWAGHPANTTPGVEDFASNEEAGLARLAAFSTALFLRDLSRFDVGLKMFNSTLKRKTRATARPSFLHS